MSEAEDFLAANAILERQVRNAAEAKKPRFYFRRRGGGDRDAEEYTTNSPSDFSRRTVRDVQRIEIPIRS